MEKITIECINKQPIACIQQPVTVGVPFPQGQLNDLADLVLCGENGKPVLLQPDVLNYWPDGSFKWVLCDFFADIPASGISEFFIESGSSQDIESGCSVEKRDNEWIVNTGPATFSVDTQILGPFRSILLQSGSEIVNRQSEVVLTGIDGENWYSKVAKIDLETTGAVRTTLKLEGSFFDSDGRKLLFVSRISFYSGTARVKLELRLHNPSAAIHPDNLWDLGDPSSVMLKEWALQLHVQSPVDECRIRPDVTADWMDLPLTGGSLYQESSGGEHWDSPVHRDCSGAVPMTQSGWVLRAGTLEASGARAQPLLLLKTTDTQISASIDRFWQRFPKELEFHDSSLNFGLLPGKFPAAHELQGGEQVTETITFDFASDGASFCFGSDILVRCSAAAYTNARVFGEGLWVPSEKNYKKLLSLALCSESGFKAKREQVDEYGWRNFGDLYADHESAFYKGEKPFVSHYNNQYDPLYSFYRLYLAGESVEWGELADDLAAHIADIDINHTDEDREEYCHGLFWHTDHYLDAGLSSHRMASREHLEHKNPAFCGGGPGAEHCYSGGLVMTYLLTGNPRYKQLVLDLADWCWISLHGPQTIGAALLRSVKNFKSLLQKKGELWPRYPFTRGTGNCLNTTLDAFELTGDSDYLDKAARLIQGTIHPDDNPDDRDLLNAELCWSYTVFLSAVGRYLYIKKLWNQIDGDFSHACESLLTYARWMIEAEYPYLEKPEILEYPNETWSAQDLRKGVVLYYAAKYAVNGEKEIFKDKSRYFFDAGLSDLMQRQTSRYTRPLVLLLQNGWAVEALQQNIEETSRSVSPASSAKPTPKVGIPEFIRRTTLDFAQVLPQTNVKREKNWLKSRLK